MNIFNEIYGDNVLSKLSKQSSQAFASITLAFKRPTVRTFSYRRQTHAHTRSLLEIAFFNPETSVYGARGGVISGVQIVGIFNM